MAALAPLGILLTRGVVCLRADSVKCRFVGFNCDCDGSWELKFRTESGGKMRTV